MAFFVTTSVIALHGPTQRQARNRVASRLRDRLGARREVHRQQRAERYVAHMPTAVLGAC
ncbi:hypothetical protein [Mycolicibacter longobardus]|uniref:Uncharacterized protein n=1 Tax=Mycolicibacter longobardus TaxID=1108812 RepID=A0A1X1YHK6_9MYCO|nr:hypothetical protein [Mycolicibacter longobardus]ORW10495.1 hypothetical protein AWC16_14095 [Mycolicibacter longobardus]